MPSGDLGGRRALAVAAIFMMAMAVGIGAEALRGLPLKGSLSALLLVAPLFALMPVRAGWWAWVASALTQGAPFPLIDGVSLNVVGTLAFMSGLAGWAASGRASTDGWRQPSGPVAFLIAVALPYFLMAALQGWDRSPIEATDSTRQVLTTLLMASAGAALFAPRGIRGLQQVSLGFAILGAAIALLGLAEFALRRDLLIQGVDTAGGLFRINGVAPNPIVYGFHLSWSLPWAFLQLANGRDRRARLFGAAAVLAILAAGFLTLNRQTLVVMAVTVLGSFALMRGAWMTRAMILCALLGFAAAPVVAPKVVERFALLGDLHYDTSFKYRRDNFRVAMRMAQSSPITGIGLGQYPGSWHQFMPDDLFYLQYERPDRPFYIDMGYAQIAAEAGFAGLGLFALTLAVAATVSFGRWGSSFTSDPEAANAYACLFFLILVVALCSAIQDTLLRPQVWIALTLAASTWPRRD